MAQAWGGGCGSAGALATAVSISCALLHTAGPRAGRKVCWIAVDFGTTAIQLAVQYKGEDAPVVVCEDEPSAVFFAKAGWILCGTDAVDASSKHAGRLLRWWVGCVWLGEWVELWLAG